MVYLWPGNVPAWNAFMEVARSQWRVGPSGPTGLDYPGVESYLRCELRARGDRLAELFRGVRACEGAVLRVWAQERALRAADGG